MPLFSGNSKAMNVLRRVNAIAVIAALLCFAALVLVVMDRTLWTTSLVFVAAGAVLAYQGKETP